MITENDNRVQYNKIIEQSDIENIAWDISKLDYPSIKKTKLFDVLESFIFDNQVDVNANTDVNYLNIIVSLSGGVDSMVLITFFIILKSYNPLINIIAIHINYKNRDETDQEEMFIKEWCNMNNIILKCHDMGMLRRATVSREYYESETKRLRFYYYTELLKTYNAKGIYLAHHKGDEQENTFSNIINGKGLLSLSAMHDISEINNVKIFRPFIDFPKSVLLEFAEKYNIPYFKDTTPIWSNRGKLRREIFPLLESVYGNKYLINFTNISNESNEWKDFIISSIVKPFVLTHIQTEIANNFKKIIIKIDNECKNNPSCFWDMIFKSQSLWIAKKTLNLIVYKITTGFIGKIPLRKNVLAELTTTELIIRLHM